NRREDRPGAPRSLAPSIRQRLLVLPGPDAPEVGAGDGDDREPRNGDKYPAAGHAQGLGGEIDLLLAAPAPVAGCQLDRRQHEPRVEQRFADVAGALQPAVGLHRLDDPPARVGREAGRYQPEAGAAEWLAGQ